MKLTSLYGLQEVSWEEVRKKHSKEVNYRSLAALRREKKKRINRASKAQQNLKHEK